MTWADEPVLAFDVETTGLDPVTARIVTATVVTIDPRSDRVIPVEIMVNPGVDIPEEAAAIHGVTTKMASEKGAAPKDSVALILSLIITPGLPVVAYNASYDLTVLRYEAARHLDVDLTAEKLPPVIDPYVIDRHVDKYRPGKRKLVDLCALYGVSLDDAHNSTADAVAAGRLAFAVAEKYPQIHKDVPVQLLHERQMVWYDQQASSFCRYLETLADRMNDKPTAEQLCARAVSVNHGWPIQTT
jgi:DNA polymerase-3 subunit epsilon